MKIKDFFNSQKPNDITVRQPYIIAEAGVNHEGDMEIAKRLIAEAKEGGADAIKFQTYKANTIASKHSPSYWDLTKEPTTSQFDLFKKYDKFWKKEFEELKKVCDQQDIEFLSTPFDVESATFLNELMDAFKISSSDLTNKPFIEYMAKFGKPIILSSGAAELHEVQEAVGWINKYNVPLALLHCVLNYPTADENANLGMIKGLAKHFPDNIIGYSDHTLPKDMKSLEVATLLGARILEKHFSHDKTLPGNDHYHAMDKEDLKVFRKNMDRVVELLGEFEVKSLPSELPAIKNARRSLVALKNIPKGKVIEYSDLTWKRPASGISPKYIDDVIGKKAIAEIEEDTVLIWHLFE
ncbi:MAG TPA: N-acetylneuraminate synthase family protein [Ohtaekwangia sp.]|uniref:N-acetylneuraminate synthase family protein n=1 Tax=Ohtaekwangia sp. TaxID=2066019 RepID=UPI002F9260B1